MNKKSTKNTAQTKSKKLKLNKQTQRDLTPADSKLDVVRGGASIGHKLAGSGAC